MPLQFLWSRKKCTARHDIEAREHYWIKNLRKVRSLGRKLDSVLVVDDSLKAHSKNYGNLIAVRRYEGDPFDRELALLIRYLPHFIEVPDVRVVDKRRWQETVE